MKNLVESISYNKVVSGEIQGSATAEQMPDISCKRVIFFGMIGNAGNVHIGGPGVTVPDGTTDTTSGIPLDAGDASPWMPISNLNLLYYICDNAGDDILYLALC